MALDTGMRRGEMFKLKWSDIDFENKEFYQAKLDTKKMSERELILKIIELSSNENIIEEELRQILDAVIKITSKRS